MVIVLLFVAAFIVLLIFTIENDFEWGSYYVKILLKMLAINMKH